MKNVLLIEPDGILGIDFERLLNKQGEKVFLAKSEVCAREYVQNHTIDVVLIEPVVSLDFLIDKTKHSNWQKHGVHGFVLLNNLFNLKDGFRKPPKIIVYSASFLQTINQAAQTAGFDKQFCYFSKPENSEVIVAEINKI